MYDVVIVGGRCAGSPLALQLARAGHRVLIVDRTTFPSDTMSTHFIQSPGIARLAKWGLLDDVFATNCPPVRRVRFVVGDDDNEMEIPLDGSIPGLAAPRRYIVDKILVDAAIAAGAELAEGVSVDSLMWDEDRVTGIRGHTASGSFEAEGRFVIGADGRHSVVGRETGAPFIQNSGSFSAGYYTYFEGFPAGGTELYLDDGLFSVVFPTNDGLTLVALGWPEDRFATIKRDVEGNFMSAADRLADLGERVRQAERVERFVGATELPNFLRRLHGPGWALIGDAGYHKDPAPADGMSDAFRGAEYLADALDDVLRGEVGESESLDRFEARHKEMAIPLLDAAVRTARFDLTPQQRFEAFFEIRMSDQAEVETMLSPNGTN